MRACTCARARRRVHRACPWPIHGGIPSDTVAHPAWYPTRPGRYLSAEVYPALHGRRTNLFGEERERDVREQHGQEREAQLRMYAVLWVLTWYSRYSDRILLSTHMRPTARRWNFSPSRAAWDTVRLWDYSAVRDTNAVRHHVYGRSRRRTVGTTSGRQQVAREALQVARVALQVAREALHPLQ